MNITEGPDDPAIMTAVLLDTATNVTLDNVTDGPSANVTEGVPGVPLEVQVRQTFMFQVAMALHFQFLPVVVVVGIPGNILTLIIMLQKKNRQISCCIYMAYLAISDNLILLYGAYTWFAAKFQFIPKTNIACGISNLVLGVVSNFNVMLLVALSVDRFLVIKYPLRAPVLCTVKRAKSAIVSMAVASVLLTLPIVFTAKYPDGKVCAAHASGTLLDQIHSVLSLVLFSVGPFVVILLLNSSIIVLIKKRCKAMDKYTDGAVPSKTKGGSVDSAQACIKKDAVKKRDLQLTVMLMTVTFVFLLLILPLNLRYIFGSLIDYKKDLYTFSVYYLILVLSAKTHIMNSAVNFFLYCLSGSKFRTDLMRLLRCGAGRRRGLKSVRKGSGIRQSETSLNETSVYSISASFSNDVIMV